MDASPRRTAVGAPAAPVASRVCATPLTVVVPLDGSSSAEAGLPVARVVARTFGAPVQRVTVEPGAGDAVGVVSVAGEAQFVLRGDVVGDALLAHLARQPAPMLCLASRARGGLHRRLTGNLVDQMVAEAACPVLVVGPGAQTEALDGTPATILLAASDELPAGAAEFSGRWAMAMDADVVVATVLSHVPAPSTTDARTSSARGEPGNGVLGGLASFPSGPNDTLLGGLVEELAGYGIAGAGYTLTGGTIATSLLAFAESLPPPVLIVAPVGERDGRIPGDVTHQLLQRGRWPVVASLGRAPVA